MPRSLKGTSNEDLATVINDVVEVLKDEDVVHFGMQAEVLGTALIYLKENPDATIKEALGAGFIEWDL